jgi:hypothetical protein
MVGIKIRVMRFSRAFTKLGAGVVASHILKEFRASVIQPVGKIEDRLIG